MELEYVNVTLTKSDLRAIKKFVRRGVKAYIKDAFDEEESIDEWIVELTFLSTSLMGFSRWYMYFGEFAEIIEPTELINLAKENIKNLSKKISL